jgi:D-serine deaminase-like pyridoxal phosphate-dependent protein
MEKRGGTLRSVKNIHDLPTPCLVLDLDRFEANLDKMSRFTSDRGIALRPHSKTHKCANIARRQIAKGAIGMCVATIAEAEVMTRAGIRGLLVTANMWANRGRATDACRFASARDDGGRGQRGER